MPSSLLVCAAFIKFTQIMKFLQKVMWPCLKPLFHLDSKQIFFNNNVISQKAEAFSSFCEVCKWQNFKTSLKMPWKLKIIVSVS